MRKPRSIERWQTNVPNHAYASTSLPPAAGYLIFAFPGLAPEHGGSSTVMTAVGALEDSAARETSADVRVVSLPDTSSESLETVRALVSDGDVGLVVALVGSERHVYAARSVALAAGAEPAEVVTLCLDVETDAEDGVRWSDSSPPRNLFCAHCHALFTAAAAVGDAVTCPSCRLLLGVHYNFSRRRAAYMATQISTVGLANRGSQP